MADFDTDYAWMQANEDAAQLHAIVPDAPPGAHAISGINSAAFPAEFAAIAAIPQAERGPAVKQFYEDHFWNQWEGMLSDAVAKRVFDAAVNMGPGTAVRLLQTAVNELGDTLTVDGAWGPATIMAAMKCDQGNLALAFIAIRCQHYRDIVAKNPADAKYLPEWLARASK